MSVRLYSSAPVIGRRAVADDGRIRKWIRPEWGPVLLGDIAEESVQLWVNWLEGLTKEDDEDELLLAGATVIRIYPPTGAGCPSVVQECISELTQNAVRRLS